MIFSLTLSASHEHQQTLNALGRSLQWIGAAISAAFACAAMAATPDASSPISTEQRVAATPELLARYLDVDTVNPPGNEIRGARFFAEQFDAAGIEYQIAESAPGRGNIWARIKGGRKPALVLLNHIDVVPADARFWDVEPLRGTLKDGFVWGRGALDMKGTAIMQLQAFLAVAASGKKLNRDLVFVATADEEAGGAFGAGWLVKNHPEIFRGAGFLLNEGGYSTRLKGDTLFLLEVTQKVPVWLRLTAQDRPGHGSSPTATTAVTRIVRAAARLADTQFPARVVPAVGKLFAGLAPYQSEELRPRFEDITSAAKDDLFMRKLQAQSPSEHALLRNTCSLTTLRGSTKINVIPPDAVLELDCRMLPDQDEASFIAEIKTIVNDPNVKIEKIMSLAPAVSPAGGDLYELIEELAAERYENGKVIPTVSTGFTDSHFFRAMGIKSYGLGLYQVPKSDARGIHGNNERLGADNLRRATETMIELVQRFTAR